MIDLTHNTTSTAKTTNTANTMQRRSHFQKTFLLQNDIGPPVPPSRQHNDPNGKLFGHQIQHYNAKRRFKNQSIAKGLFGICCILLLLTTLWTLHQVDHTGKPLVLHFLEWCLGFRIYNYDPLSPSTTTTTTKKIKTTTIELVRQEFYRRYGGETMAQGIYRRGIQSFLADSGSNMDTSTASSSESSSLYHTAQRLLQILASTSSSASASSTPQFVLSFAGYSVTVGRGNHYNQSYPFVLQRILQPLLFSEMDGMELIVRNSAIGGIPSFPYGFCLAHFLGSDANGISWDYSMNEGKSSTVLEAYLRQSQSQLAATHPMMIVLDTNIERCQLLKKYIDSNLLRDGICVGMAKDAVPNLKTILSDSNVPLGFQNWDEFGAPPNCPGRGNWHPKMMEHELIGWMIAMYFVDAVELAQQIMAKHPNDWQTMHISSTPANDMWQFPPPLTMSSLPENNNVAVTNLLYGHVDPTKSHFTMNHVSCRTNFLPAIDAEKVLSSIIVDGFNTDTSSENIMTPRADDMYEKGWVLDVSNIERDTKVKVEQCGGLGYIDMKISLYGIPSSGTLRLWLPIESSKGHGSIETNREDGNAAQLATNYYSEFIICEANEKRKDGACRLDTDMEYIVGGSATKLTPTLIHGAGEYLKRPTCVHVGIPEDAVVTVLNDVRPINPKNNLDTGSILRRLAGGDTSPKYDLNQIGLVIDIRAKENVSRGKGACCISHVVWEEKQFDR